MNTEEFLRQLDEAIVLCNRALSASRGGQYSSSASVLTSEAATTAFTLADHISGSESIYYKQIGDAIRKNGITSWPCLPAITGVLQGLKKAVSQGLLDTIKGEIQGELLCDFLERATWLLSENHKDAAAVVAGSVLEEHLRQLSVQSTIELDLEVNGGLIPKKADRLNSELSKANAYSKLDQKSVTAWLDLRNKAAHGHYREYESAQVGLMISGVRDFINRMNV